MRAQDEQEIRRIVGRDLDASELATFATLDAISPEVEELAATIFKRGRILAFLYLRERVPNGDFDDTKLRLEKIAADRRQVGERRGRS